MITSINKQKWKWNREMGYKVITYIQGVNKPDNVNAVLITIIEGDLEEHYKQVKKELIDELLERL